MTEKTVKSWYDKSITFSVNADGDHANTGRESKPYLSVSDVGGGHSGSLVGGAFVVEEVLEAIGLPLVRKLVGVETNPIGDIADLIASQRTQIAERDRTINAQSSNIRTYQRKIQELREAESGFLARKQDMDQEKFLLRQERDEAVRNLDVFRTEVQVAKTALQRLGLI